MTDLLAPSASEPDAEGRVLAVSPESAGWRYVGLEVLRLGRGQAVARDTGDREVCVVMLGGRCSVEAAGIAARDVGARTDPFGGLPSALYVPPGAPYRVEALSETLELAVCSAPAREGAEARLIRPEEIAVEVRGAGSFERRIHPILMEDRPAERLLVVEVRTPAGHWSSYPPHKHDRAALPEESELEETYYHRIAPSHGFALQRVYTADRTLDETVTVRDGDCVLVPRGYHAVSAAPGYELYYLNVMAGPVREWKVTTDPAHAWLLGGPDTSTV